MRTEPIFRGVATALITPTTASGVDYPRLGRLIDWQIGQGINALVIAGTTGEGTTLSDGEHRDVLKFSAERIAGRVPMIAGTGSNDTAYAVSLTQYACEIGADAMLVVTPYYNKATQRGLIESFTAIADASTRPLILYNVPSRTGCTIEPATYAALADHPMIAAIKEAGGNISKIVRWWATGWTSIPATTTRSSRSCPWAASASFPSCPTSRRSRRWRSASVSSPGTWRAARRCNAGSSR